MVEKTNVVSLVQDDDDLEALGLKVDGAMEALSKHYKADSPDQKLRFLIKNMIHPLLDLMRKEYIGGLSYLEDEIEDVASGDASEEFTEQTRRTVAVLGQVLDATWARVGWLNDKGITDSAPKDLQEALKAATALVSELLERAAAEDEDEDDDDGDDDPDGGEPAQEEGVA